MESKAKAVKENSPAPPVEGMTVIPAYADNPITMGGWIGLVEWASTQAEAKAAFKEETEHDLDSVLMARGLDKLIDESTGRTREIVIAWCDWVTRTAWGVYGEEPDDASDE